MSLAFSVGHDAVAHRVRPYRDTGGPTTIAALARWFQIVSMQKPPSVRRLLDFFVAVDVENNDGLYELNEAMHALYKATLGIKPVDIGRIAEFWLDRDEGFSSAGFLLLLNSGRRIHLEVGVDQTSDDGSKPPRVDIDLEELADDQQYPAFISVEQAPNGWRHDVRTLNDFLVFAWPTPDHDDK